MEVGKVKNMNKVKHPNWKDFYMQGKHLNAQIHVIYGQALYMIIVARLRRVRLCACLRFFCVCVGGRGVSGIKYGNFKVNTRLDTRLEFEYFESIHSILVSG